MQTTAASAVWSPEEDEQLRRLVEQHGVKKWALIAKELQTKKSKQCRRRWKNYLDADLKTAPWTPEEDATLIKGQKLFGNKWTEIAKLVGGRTDNAVKNRWASLCKKSSSLGVSVSEAATGASGASSDDDEGAPASTQGRAASPQLRQASAAARAPPTAFPKRPRVSRPQRSESTERASAPEQWEIEDRAPEEAGRASPHPRLQRVGPPSFRHLSIAIPEPPDHPPADGSHNSARSGPLSIRVYRDSLSEGERQLAQELNCMAAPVQIVLEPRPMTWDSLASARAPPRSGHGATPEAGWETAARGDSSPSDIVRWLAMGTGHSPEGFRPGLRSRLAPGGTGPGTPGTPIQPAHRQLLHKLLSKGIDAQNAWSAQSQAAGTALPSGQSPPGRRYHIAVSTSRPSEVAPQHASPGTPPEAVRRGPESPTVEVLVSPTFSSQELQLLLEALGDGDLDVPDSSHPRQQPGPVIRDWMPGPQPMELPPSKRPRLRSE